MNGRMLLQSTVRHYTICKNRVSIQINSEKEKLWQEIADRASRITDKLGMPIDQGITTFLKEIFFHRDLA